jgi:hypothetical protein
MPDHTILRRGDKGDRRSPVLEPPDAPRRAGAVPRDTLCPDVHISLSPRSKIQSLRGELLPREGAGQLLAPLLDQGPLPDQLPAERQ